MSIYLNDLGLLCAAGSSKKEVLSNLLAGNLAGLIQSDQFTPGAAHFIGAVQTELPNIEPRLSIYDCRNNRLLLAALAQIRSTVDRMIDRYGPKRVGIVLGTSTSGLRNTELALAEVASGRAKPKKFHYKQQQFGAGADFLALLLRLEGPAYVISTACSSSGHAIASARRLLNLGCCDAVIAGGADSLCRFTLSGFTALASVSSGRCKPFGLHRDGINIGEAAALFVLSHEQGPVELSGIGATTDAYHFSAPDPQGTAVINAMKIALKDAGLPANSIDYINLHGTATPLNDAMESQAVYAVFGNHVAVSSSKGMTGHALGAASALELGICWLLLTQNDDQGRLIPNVNNDDMDPNLPSLNFAKIGASLGRRIDRCQSNSFAFGGNNVSIVLSRS